MSEPFVDVVAADLSNVARLRAACWSNPVEDRRGGQSAVWEQRRGPLVTGTNHDVNPQQAAQKSICGVVFVVRSRRVPECTLALSLLAALHLHFFSSLLAPKDRQLQVVDLRRRVYTARIISLGASSGTKDLKTCVSSSTLWWVCFQRSVFSPTFAS